MYMNTNTPPRICKGQRFSQTINSNWTFPDTNPGIKKNHNPIKTVVSIKPKRSSQIGY